MRLRRTLLAVLALSLGLAAVPVEVGATVLVADTPTTAWRVDGTTQAVLVVGSTTYVGGTFTRATAPNGTTVARANVAAFDTRTGALVETFRADTNGTVRALVSDGTTLWVGGSYTTVAGQRRNRLAAVDLATGAPRAGFAPSVNSNVYALDLRAGRLFVGGSFSSVSGVARSRAAAVDPFTGAVDTRWNPGADETVQAVRADPTARTVYLGGSFTRIGNASRIGLAAVDGTTGAVGPALAGTFRPTLDLDMDPSGRRLFAAVGGGGNQAVAWDTVTGNRLWRQWADGDVQTVAYHRDTLYFGFHESFGGDLSLRLLAADASTGALDPDFRPTFDRYWGLFDLSVTDDVVAAAGDFTEVGGVAARGIVLFPADRPPPPPPPDIHSYVGLSSTWRFHDTGTQPGPAWYAPGFDDSGFRSGRAPLGYGDGDEATTVSFGPSASNKHITTYFRTTFDVPVEPTAGSILLTADDGAVVYVNGSEVARDNMPAGVVTNATRAASNRSGSAETQIRRFRIPPGLLTVGTNTVAASVHQDVRSSSDLRFALQVEGEVPAIAPSGPVATTTTTAAPEPTTTTAPPAPTTTTSSTPPPAPTTTTAPPAPTTTTTTTAAPAPVATVLARWSDGRDTFSQTTGVPPVVETGGSYGERLRWTQQPGQHAFRTWTGQRLGPPTAHQTLRWVATFSGFPAESFSLAQGFDDSVPLVQRWRIELTPAGRVRIRDAANAISAVSTGQGVPLDAEIRFEAVRAGTTMTVSAYSPPTAVAPLLAVSGPVGSSVNHVRIGNVLRTPTVPSFTVDEVVLTSSAAPVGPPG